MVAKTHRRYRATEFRKRLESHRGQRAVRLDVDLILDNYATHKTRSFGAVRQAPAVLCAFHADLPLVAQPDRALVAALTRQSRRGVHRSFAKLEATIHACIDHNDVPTPFAWTKSADDILASIAQFAHGTVVHRR